MASTKDCVLDSAAYRFSDIPDLLEEVFVLLDAKDILPAICVNKQWSVSALDVLWRDIDDLGRLCHVLADLSWNGNTYSFARPLRPDDWARFDQYATRVHRLSISRKTRREPTPSIFDQIARTRSRLDILPNLRSLQWDFRLLDSLIFMHPGVNKFSVTLPNDFPSTSINFSPYLKVRLPDLEVLEMTTNNPINNIAESLVSTIRDHSKLRRALLHFSPQSNIVVETLSRLPVLQQITLKSPWNTTPDFEIFLCDGAFPSLRDICFPLSFHASVKFITQANAPSELTHIRVESPLSESPAHLTEFLNAIAERFPGLEALYLGGSMSSAPSHAQERVDMRNLRPILKCARLKSLQIVHYHPFQLYLEDIRSIAASLPHLEDIILNCSPVRHESDVPSLTLLSFLPFAQHCPKLRRLGFYLHACSIDVSSPDQLPTFLNLQSLCVGFSTVTNPRSVAFVLSYLCPYVKSIVKGNDWMNNGSERGARDGQVDKGWEEVESLLPLLSEVRAEERAYARRILNKELLRCQRQIDVVRN